MAQRFFEPWVGCNYFIGINGKRVMVMPHDHVCGGCDRCGIVEEREECALFTQKTVKDYLQWRKTGVVPSPDYIGWLKTYLKFVKAVFGEEPDIETEVKELWDKILFSNYLQVSVPTHDTPAPTLAYEQAQEPFIELINDYQPDLIIAWGDGAYDYTPPYNGRNLEPLVFGNVKALRYEYTLELGKKSVMMKIHHPSYRYFNYQIWHEIIKSALNCSATS